MRGRGVFLSRRSTPDCLNLGYFSRLEVAAFGEPRLRAGDNLEYFFFLGDWVIVND